MITRYFIHCSLLLAAAICGAADPQSFDTSWITAKPEVLTYRTTGKQGDGFYQVSLWKTGNGIELYMNIIAPGFTKSVWGSMAADFHARESKSRILVDNQIVMTTDCSYRPNGLRIATVIGPYNRVADNTLSFSNLVVDFSQTPLLPRTLPLKLNAEFKFDSLNPQSNSLVPLTIRVLGEEKLHGIECYKVEGNDFEGQSTCWIEKGGSHRVMRIEQPERITELILTPLGVSVSK
jgi:hypothetical protein